MHALVSLLLAIAGAAQVPPSVLPDALRRATATPIGGVETIMRGVIYRADERVALRIAYLRGVLRPTDPAQPPWFEDPASFVIAVDSAVTSITPASLSALLNGHVFNYPGAPLSRLVVRVVEGELELRGVLHKGVPLRFTIRARATMTPDGRLRVRPTSVTVLGISSQGLMRFLSLELDDLMRIRPGRGVEVAGNDLFLSPAALMPPPRITGVLTSFRLLPNAIVMVLGPARRRVPPPLVLDTAAAHFMYFAGGVLRFGKLTMAEADLAILDADPSDPFDFLLAQFNRQLVAGHTRNRADFGLVTIMPDYADLPRVQHSPER